MKVGIVATHSFPIGWDIAGTPPTGDVVMLDLAHGLAELGHEVSLFAPAGTEWPRVYEMPAGKGAACPLPSECELRCLVTHRDALESMDVIHDFSVDKCIGSALCRHRPVVQTLMGGPWRSRFEPHNVCVWSAAHRDRVLRGATDYEGTSTPELGGPLGKPVNDAVVVHGGVNTDFYCRGPGGDRYLWLNRWHPAKGCAEAIDIAKRTGIELTVAGQHPSTLLWESEKRYATKMSEEAVAAGCELVWLPERDHHTKKRELYRHAKALLYPVQFCEPFGLSMAEAMSCGTPVVGAKRGSVQEIVYPRGGRTYDDGPGALADLGGASWLPPRDHVRAYAVENFSRVAFATRYAAIYRRVMQGERW